MLPAFRRNFCSITQKISKNCKTKVQQNKNGTDTFHKKPQSRYVKSGVKRKELAWVALIHTHIYNHTYIHTHTYSHALMLYQISSSFGLADPLGALPSPSFFYFLCNLLSSSYQASRHVISCCCIFYSLSECFVQTPVKRNKIHHYRSALYEHHSCHSGKSLRKMRRKIDIFPCNLYFSFVLDSLIKFSAEMCSIGLCMQVYLCADVDWTRWKFAQPQIMCPRGLVICNLLWHKLITERHCFQLISANASE